MEFQLRKEMPRNRILTFLSIAVILSGCGPIRKIRPPVNEPPRPADNASKPAVIISEGREKPEVISVPAPKVEDPLVSIPTREALTKLEKIMKIARSKLGCRYQSAGKGPNSFDCSGFTGFVFRQVGINLGASSRDQFTDGRALSKGEELRPGDLVFFNGRKVGNTVGHVGMVVDYDRSTGEFTFIHAAVSTGVEIQKSTADYYARRYMGARRVLPETMERVSEAEAAALTAAPEPEVAESEPAAEQKPADPPQPEPVYHTVKSGDTLSALAVKYHTTVSRICSLNGITSRTILKIGRKLRMK